MTVPDPLLKPHCMAFMYLTFAHQSDGELTDDELSVIRTKIREWQGDGADAQEVTDRCIGEAIDWYNSLDSNQRINGMDGIARLWKSQGVSAEQRGAIVADLISIAKADGNYDDTEKKWVEMLTAAMEEGVADTEA